MSYAGFEADVALESKNGSVSWGRVASEMVLNCSTHGAPLASKMLCEMTSTINRQNHRANRAEMALKALLFALHARPLFGGPHLSLEDAIAQANELLDARRTAAQ